jgi:phosphoribosylformylglycinamidine synthase
MSHFQARVSVSLRPAILDVQGKAVEHALHSLGYSGCEDVRVGKTITFSVDAPSDADARKIVDEACHKLLSNPIIEDYSFELIAGA